MSNNSIVGRWTVSEQWFVFIPSPRYSYDLVFNADGTLSVDGFTGAWQQNGEVVMFTLAQKKDTDFGEKNGSYIGQLKEGKLKGSAVGYDKILIEVPELGKWSAVAATPSAKSSGGPLNIDKPL